MPDSPEVDRGAAERMTFFSDAVVAIAITLLAIDLPVPQGDTSAELLGSVAEHGFEYLAFLISFVVIARNWAAHHKVFRWVRRADGPVVGLNLLWLFLVVINPFLTRVLTEGEVDLARFAPYAVAQTVQLGTFAVMVAVLARRGWFAPDAPGWLTDRGWVHALIPASGFLLSLPAFPFIGTWAFAVWAVVPIVGGRILRWTGVVPRESA